MRTSDRNSKYIEEEFKNMKFANKLDIIIQSIIISETIIEDIINTINSQSKLPSNDAVAVLKKINELSNVTNAITSGIIDGIINNQKCKRGV